MTFFHLGNIVIRYNSSKIIVVPINITKFYPVRTLYIYFYKINKFITYNLLTINQLKYRHYILFNSVIFYQISLFLENVHFWEKNKKLLLYGMLFLKKISFLPFFQKYSLHF